MLRLCPFLPRTKLIAPRLRAPWTLKKARVSPEISESETSSCISNINVSPFLLSFNVQPSGSRRDTTTQILLTINSEKLLCHCVLLSGFATFSVGQQHPRSDHIHCLWNPLRTPKDIHWTCSSILRRASIQNYSLISFPLFLGEKRR
jgi:hypothetical protein